MTFNEAMALQPAWVGIWLNVLLLGAFIMPLALFIWRETRLTALITLIASILAAVSINLMYMQMGYVKLLGLPHLILWGPLVFYYLAQFRRADLPIWPRRIMWFILIVIAISLAFDVFDVLRYILGDRTPMAGTAPL